MNTSHKNAEQVLDQLRGVLPDTSLITDAAGLKPYETDGLTAIRELPWLVVLPTTEQQVVEVVNICRQHQVPIIARGAGTGLSGGARPHKHGVVLGLSKMNQILHVDEVNSVARVQPGVRNLAITEAAKQFGLYYAPDPSSQIACSIGGNVAENAGGVHCLKYGLTVHNVLGVRVVTSDGEVLEIGGAVYDRPGLDLLALLCGSEGMLGIVTEVTVALLPQPQQKSVILVGFDEVTKAGAAVADIIAAGIIPAGMEMMDKRAVEAAEQFAHAGYPLEAAAILIIELDGSDTEVAALTRQVSEILRSAGASHIECADDEHTQARLWKGRKSAFPAVGRLSPDYLCMDGTIPRARLAEVLTRIDELSSEFNLAVANVFHAADGNLHPLILFDANVDGQTEQAMAMGARILEVCVEMGGTVTGEHGVGVEKLDTMCVQFNAAELEQFFAIKRAMDSADILNPGKGIPTLTRCGELGGMHVHGGHLPFPEIERF
ncbi:MAG: FAD-linked oxidase C-terminal domain-containing protein [Pseudomonadota bacterium]|nr:FAD-linked oxidase C-terminal domain-containing protein [Pseudomonadota bacterium]MED5581559.1 FAD-linked oxidase C-terminal domain-containing protein [Pseudomonadota bacterium]